MATSQISYVTPENAQYNFNNAYTPAQSFTTVDSITVTSVKVKLYRSATTGGTLTLSIRTMSAGYPSEDILTSGTRDRNDVSSSSPGGWIEFDVTDYVLDATTQYAIVISQDVVATTSWRSDSAEDGGYAGGQGSTLYLGSWAAALMDMMFDIWGDVVVTYSELSGDCAGVGDGSGDLELNTYSALAGTCAAVGGGSGDLGSTLVYTSGYATYRRLIAVGNNQIWYEDI